MAVTPGSAFLADCAASAAVVFMVLAGLMLPAAATRYGYPAAGKLAEDSAALRLIAAAQSWHISLMLADRPEDEENLLASYGINLGLVPEEYALEYLIKLVQDRINTEKYRGIPHMPDRIGYLRAIAIGTLVQDAVRVFMEEEEAILNGELEVALLDKSRYRAQIEDIINLSVERIYQAPEVVEKEVAGYKILSDILEVSTEALLAKLEGRLSSYDRLILSMLPIEGGQPQAVSVYEVLLQACSFVASLSDRAAVHIHNKISGKQLQDQNV